MCCDEHRLYIPLYQTITVCVFEGVIPSGEQLLGESKIIQIQSTADTKGYMLVSIIVCMCVCIDVYLYMYSPTPVYVEVVSA